MVAVCIGIYNNLHQEIKSDCQNESDGNNHNILLFPAVKTSLLHLK